MSLTSESDEKICGVKKETSDKEQKQIKIEAL